MIEPLQTKKFPEYGEVGRENGLVSSLENMEVGDFVLLSARGNEPLTIPPKWKLPEQYGTRWELYRCVRLLRASVELERRSWFNPTIAMVGRNGEKDLHKVRKQHPNKTSYRTIVNFDLDRAEREMKLQAREQRLRVLMGADWHKLDDETLGKIVGSVRGKV